MAMSPTKLQSSAQITVLEPPPRFARGLPLRDAVCCPRLCGYSLPSSRPRFQHRLRHRTIGPPSRFPQCISNGKTICLRLRLVSNQRNQKWLLSDTALQQLIRLPSCIAAESRRLLPWQARRKWQRKESPRYAHDSRCGLGHCVVVWCVAPVRISALRYNSERYSTPSRQHDTTVTSVRSGI
jgi:hypothetical protein